MGGVEAPCHPYFGAHDGHVLLVPAEIQTRLDEEERHPPGAVGNPFMPDATPRKLTILIKQAAHETAEGVICRHPPGLLYTLRFRRELSVEERDEARCDDCGRVASAFLLQCIGCRALLCLELPGCGMGRATAQQGRLA